MKYLIFLSLVLTSTCFGQELTTNEKNGSTPLTTKKKTIELQQIKIDALAGELEQARAQSLETSQLIAKLQKENETLRTIMRDYVKQIDELNMKNVQLATELDKCKDGK